jgi:hypothetical protein
MMIEKNYRFASFTILALSTISFGCSSANAKDDMTECTEPRPEICTMDYTPVCGLQRVSGTEQWKTYSNACSACSDFTVIGYKKDACAAGEE